MPSPQWAADMPPPVQNPSSAIMVSALLHLLDPAWIRKVRSRDQIYVRKMEVAVAMHGWLLQLDNAQYGSLRDAMGIKEEDARCSANSRDTLLTLCESVLDGTETGRPMTSIIGTMRKMLRGAFGILVGPPSGDAQNRKWVLENSLYTEFHVVCSKPMDRRESSECDVLTVEET